MAQVTSEIRDVIADTSEARLAVRTEREFVFSFAIKFDGKQCLTLSFEKMLQDWILQKGEVYFKSMEVKVAFGAAGQQVAIAYGHRDSSISDFDDVMFLPNRVVFGSNSMNCFTEQVDNFSIPAGYTNKIWPATGALPIGALHIATANAIEGTRITLFLKVDATGPFVNNFTVNSKTGVCTLKRGSAF